MKKILFVCYGNICRSTMAQWIAQHWLDEHRVSGHYEIDSAAVSSEETGEPIYYAAAAKLAEKGIPIGQHQARKLTWNDYTHFDHIYVMDQSNLAMARALCKNDPEGKIELLLPEQEVSDPWYTRNFEQAYQDICTGIRKRLKEAGDV